MTTMGASTWAFSGAALAALALTAGCQSGSSQPPQPPVVVSGPGASESAAAVTAGVVERYFQGIAGDGGRSERAARLARPGSPAAVFAEHHAALSRAQGGSDVSVSIGLTEDAVQWNAQVGSDSSEVSEFTDFAFDGRGRLVDWSLPDGSRIGGSIRELGSELSAGGATITPITAYRTSGGEIQITFSGRSNREISVSPEQYTAGNLVYEPENQPYSLDLLPGATAYGWSVVQNADWPGQLHLLIDYDSGLAIQVDAPDAAETPRKGNTP